MEERRRQPADRAGTDFYMRCGVSRSLVSHLVKVRGDLSQHVIITINAVAAAIHPMTAISNMGLDRVQQ
jgi:hypothetical protein